MNTKLRGTDAVSLTAETNAAANTINEFLKGPEMKKLSAIAVSVPIWSRFVEAANRAESI